MGTCVELFVCKESYVHEYSCIISIDVIDCARVHCYAHLMALDWARYYYARNITIESTSKVYTSMRHLHIHATLHVDGWHGEWLLRHCSCFYIRTLTTVQKASPSRLIYCRSRWSVNPSASCVCHCRCRLLDQGSMAIALLYVHTCRCICACTSSILAYWKLIVRHSTHLKTSRQISDGHFDSVYRDNVASTHTSWPKYQQCLVLHSNAGSNSTTKYPRRTPQPPNTQWQYSPSNLDNSAIEHRFLRLYTERLHCCIGIWLHSMVALSLWTCRPARCRCERYSQ
jgi:hypothetical protein